jgi:ADP-ribose pyrophosphatase YjhB (NUDIX family)
MTVPITDQLLRRLVASSHAEGTVRLAVAAAIEHDDRVLLIAALDDDFETIWQLPAELVLPGETLLQALDRTVTTTTGLGITNVTSYAGHHDLFVDDDVARTFVFTVTADDPDRICRWANLGHRWTSDPITACSIILGDIACHPTGTITPAGFVIRPSPIDQLATALRANAKGALCEEAAVDLLITHQTWLRRRDFVDGFIDTQAGHQSTAQLESAFVDWAAALAALDAGDLPCSGGEGRLLRIAGSLAEGIPVDLRDAITGLDAVNTGLVASAICHAAGHRR